jgi:hypothetical protein
MLKHFKHYICYSLIGFVKVAPASGSIAKQPLVSHGDGEVRELPPSSWSTDTIFPVDDQLLMCWVPGSTCAAASCSATCSKTAAARDYLQSPFSPGNCTGTCFSADSDLF